MHKHRLNCTVMENDDTSLKDMLKPVGYALGVCSQVDDANEKVKAMFLRLMLRYVVKMQLVDHTTT